MKYCEFCGDKLEDNALCNCAEAVAQRESTDTADTKSDEQTQTNEMFKKYKLPIIIGTVALVLLFVLIGILTTASKKNPFDYTEVSFSGYNTNGRITVEFDSDRLVEDILGEEPDDFEKAMAYYEKYDELQTAISYNVSNEEGLSNGDTVTIEFLVMPSSSSKVKACKGKFNVEGLSEVETVDVFKDLEVSFEGMNGNGKIIIEKLTNDEFISALTINLADTTLNYNISNGDEIEVVIICSDSVAEKYGKIPAKTSGVFTVSGLSEYATTEDLPTDVINSYATKFLEAEKANNIKETSSMFSYSDAEIYGVYFAENKGEAFTNENELHIIVNYTQYLYGEYHSSIYKHLIFEDITVNADGAVNIEYEDGSERGTFTSNIEKYLSELEDDYTVTKIG